MKMKVFSLLAAVLVSLAANAETKEIVWDSSTIQRISLGKSVGQSMGDTALIVFAKDNIYLKMEDLSGTNIDFYGRGLYTNGQVFFTPSKGKLTQVVINASQQNVADGWRTQDNQLIWTGDSPRAYIYGNRGSVAIEGIQDISFTVEVPTDTISPVSGVEVNEANFPDANFRRWIQSQSYGSDGVLTADEIAYVKTMNIYDKYIASLQGIEFFTALTDLQCQRNQLTSLDVSKNTALTNLAAFDNQLTSLNVNGCAALTGLSCSGNRLSSLTTFGCTSLTNLTCYSNQIKGAAMDSLVMSLPVVSSGKINVLYYKDEANVMTTTQAAAAKAKGWIPQWFDLNYGWAEYAGSEPEAPTYSISGIPAGWKVNGEVIAGSDTTSVGIVRFPEGAEVIFTPANVPAGKKIKSIKVVRK